MSTLEKTPKIVLERCDRLFAPPNNSGLLSESKTRSRLSRTNLPIVRICSPKTVSLFRKTPKIILERCDRILPHPNHLDQFLTPRTDIQECKNITRILVRCCVKHEQQDGSWESKPLLRLLKCERRDKISECETRAESNLVAESIEKMPKIILQRCDRIFADPTDSNRFLTQETQPEECKNITCLLVSYSPKHEQQDGSWESKPLLRLLKCERRDKSSECETRTESNLVEESIEKMPKIVLQRCDRIFADPNNANRFLTQGTEPEECKNITCLLVSYSVKHDQQDGSWESKPLLRILKNERKDGSGECETRAESHLVGESFGKMPKIILQRCDRIFADPNHSNRFLTQETEPEECKNITCLLVSRSVKQERQNGPWESKPLLRTLKCERASGGGECETRMGPNLADSPTNVHQKNGTANKPYYCPDCPMKFSTFYALKLHLKIHNKEERHACSHCPAKFWRFLDLKYHLTTHTGRKTFKCDQCPASFRFKSNLTRHLPIHLGKKPYTCDHCSRQFLLLQSLKMHLKVHTGERRYVCAHCSARFTLKSGLKRHVKIHADDKPYACDKCAQAFRLWKERRTHLLTHESPFVCAQCPARFKTASSLRIHSGLHGGTPFKCTLCSAGFGRHEDWRIHYKNVHSEDKPYLCAHCPRKFSYSSELKKHLEWHNGEKKYSCAHCPLKWLDKGHLRQHLWRVHFGEKQHSCPECPRKFHTLLQLNYHMTMHKDEKPYICSTCSAAFKRPSYLKRHLIVHSDETPFCCAVCSAKFSRKKVLRVHMLLHLEHKPYSCPKCSRKFSTAHYLKKHIKSRHTDGKIERPYSCEHCSASFPTLSYFKVHLKRHSGQKPYSCAHCSAKFVLNSDLRMHSRVHLDDKPYACTECPYRCRHKHYLKKHMETHNTEKRFTCADCSESFAKKCDLRYHVRTHSARTVFSCAHCPGKYFEKGSLVIHMRVHFQERRFRCKTCSLRFFSSRELRSHIRAVHRNKVSYVCAVCCAKFKTRGGLRFHSDSHSSNPSRKKRSLERISM